MIGFCSGSGSEFDSGLGTPCYRRESLDSWVFWEAHALKVQSPHFLRICFVVFHSLAYTNLNRGSLKGYLHFLVCHAADSGGAAFAFLVFVSFLGLYFRRRRNRDQAFIEEGKLNNMERECNATKQRARSCFSHGDGNAQGNFS